MTSRIAYAGLAAGIAAGLLALAMPRAYDHARQALAQWQAGAQARQEQSLEAAGIEVRNVPLNASRWAIGLAGTDAGHWRMINRSGEVFTASGPTELERGFRTLAPESEGRADRLALYITEHSIFQHAAEVKRLPAASLHVLRNGKPHRLFRIGAGDQQQLFVEIHPRQLLEAKDRALFGEVSGQLARKLVRAQVRMLALQPGGPTFIPTTPRVDTSARLALADAIDPAALPGAMAALSGQIALLSGRIEGGQLAYTPSNGSDGRMAVRDAFGAAAASDANLMLLGSSSARQPGTRNWLWQRVELSSLHSAIQATTVGDFMGLLAGEGDLMVIQARRSGEARTEIALTPARRAANDPIGTLTELVGATWSDLVSETHGSVAVRGLRASLLTVARQAEIERRFFAGVPSIFQYGYLALMACGLLGWTDVRVWWHRLWPPEHVDDYGGRAGYVLARAVRVAAFVGVFLPVVAIPGLLTKIGRVVFRRHSSPAATT